MHASEVKQLIVGAIPDAEVSVEGEGCNFSVTVISPVFEGLSSLKKQQAVLAPLSAKITSGELHAVTINAYAPTQGDL
ncbi:MAG: BolA/IbaG family iron-sulfur metabolism protein [Gammaproteobacteria bacterium]|nr:BolA/IbaG family iron-sulfur metabolism protein [Gammaproteobacteria bacterium]